MSYAIINGKQIELLTDINDTSDNIHMNFQERKRRVILKRRFGYIPTNYQKILGKRKLVDVFGSGMHDEERYGQLILSDFFNTNIGHGVYQNIHNEKKII